MSKPRVFFCNPKHCSAPLIRERAKDGGEYVYLEDEAIVCVYVD